ncbi:helix-turn-helix domain-containing protein [Streptococcus pyogenes]|uniref:helix-turn-helix domain-containing protein n=1 Tax=Streptococcus pyogenes TaxID=1314 RepID=UPI000DFAC9D3|nr:helix-turn-helix transcriptional regulator [Streptococcus pyogenes]SUO76264.1 transcriptional regulator [Streptococcus pyogenes]
MNNLRNLRKESNLTQDELSKIIGVNLRTLQKWENGESSIRKKNAEKLSEHFGVSVGYLLGYETDNVLLETLSKKMANLSPNELVEYTKTADYSNEKELFELLFENSQKIDRQTDRGRKIKDIIGLLRGLDLDDLYLVNNFVERLYFSEYSMEDDEKLDNKREQLRKELEQSET